MIDTGLLTNVSFHRNVQARQQIVAPDGKRELCIVVEGTVAVTPVGGGTMQTLGKGEVFGGESLFLHQSGGVVLALTDATLFVMDQEHVKEIAQASPQLMLSLLEDAYRRGQPKEAVVSAVPQKEQKAEEQAAFLPEGHKGYRGVYRPEYLDYTYEKGYTCPNCKKTFRDKKIRGSRLISSAPDRYDFRHFYKDFDVVWYEIVTCPHCFFSMFDTHFTDDAPPPVRRILQDSLEEVKKGFLKGFAMDITAERDLEYVFDGHYLALACAAGYQNVRQLRGKIWSNISWLYEDLGEKDLERYAAAQAAAYYEELYSQTTMTMAPEREQWLCLTVAGLLYRTGKVNECRRWAFMAKTCRGGKRAYQDMADVLLDVTREKRNMEPPSS